MKAIILAGGKGERLRPITDKIPKPMVLVGKKPILEYNITLLRRFGIKDIILCVGYLAEQIKVYFKDGRKFGLNITYSHEEQPLGTAGAVRKLSHKIKDEFIVCYGDIIRDLDIKELLSFYGKKNGIGAICIYKNNNPAPKSNIEFNMDKKITAFVERPNKKPKGKVWSNASFYIFKPDIFSFIPKVGTSDFGRDVIPSVLKRGKNIYAYKQSGYFLDIGNMLKLKQAENDFRKGKFHVIN